MRDLDGIIAELRRRRAELEADGVVGAAVFGSVARQEADAESDIDIAVQFQQSVRMQGFGYARVRQDLTRRLTELLGAPVELSDEASLRPRVRAMFDREAVRAF